MKAALVRTDRLRHVRWLDHGVWQFPIDAWILQEVISDLRPELIVETGTYRGGSAFYFATVLDLLGVPGQVISIDLSAEETIPHPRITYIAGSSLDAGIVGRVSEIAHGASQVLVVLDSDHSAEHVGRELELYAPLVPLGGYVHVQDGWVDELGFGRRTGPGPASAARQFLASNRAFVRDVEVERRYVVTANDHGWLRRVSEDSV
jgi:cephalosporin hydroxylase